MLSQIRSKKYVKDFAWVLVVAMIFSTTGPVWAAGPGGGANDICTADDLGDIPMMLQINAGPPPLLMITLDNSVSMNYEVITNEDSGDPEENRLFTAPDGTVYTLIFNGGVEASAANKHAWKCQWYLVNKMYYNPHVGARNEYTHWPNLKSDVDVDDPPLDPAGGATYDLTATWAEIQYMAAPNPPPPPLAPDFLTDPPPPPPSASLLMNILVQADPLPVIVDDADAGFSKWMTVGKWLDTSFGDEYGGTGVMTDKKKNTYGGSWTTSALDTNWIYDVYAMWHADSSYADNIGYAIHDGNIAAATLATVYPVDQSANGGVWNLLASDVVFSTTTGTVELQDYYQPDADTHAFFDAVKFIPVAEICTDDDSDGFSVQDDARCPGDPDCDDGNAAINPGAVDICEDGIDQDCDGSDATCACTDDDSDGYNVDDGICTAGPPWDCDDTNGGIHPGAIEVCDDGIDQDCDTIDPPCPCTDADGDGFNFPASGCEPFDCDDTDGSIYPGAVEICGDGIDQDCDGSDLACACVDGDLDGFPLDDGICTAGPPWDCDDTDGSIYPGAVEICGDGIDQDCDGIDPPCLCVDGDGDGYYLDDGICPDGPFDCEDGNPAIHPGAESNWPACTDGIDNDCDGLIDAAGGDPDCLWCWDHDGDGHHGNPHPGCNYLGPLDCDDDSSDDIPGNPGSFAVNIYPGASEICGDGIDQDCDGSDSVCMCTDADGDGFSLDNGTCTAGPPWDCDDTDGTINPGAVEICGDGIDQDCDTIDPPCPCTDNDGDGFNFAAPGCEPFDCDDNDINNFPGNVEDCSDGTDNDCDGLVDYDDPGCCTDLDGDGWSSEDLCANGGDCDDDSSDDILGNPGSFAVNIHPGATEICDDGIDQDCDGNDLACVAKTINILRRHFYVKSTDNLNHPDPYLVNLEDKDTAQFFELEDGGTIGLAEFTAMDSEYYEVKWANLPPDLQAILPEPAVDAYAGHLQNFANWFTYYRKRTFAAKNAIGVVVSEMSNMIVGIQDSPPNTKTGGVWINSHFDGHYYDQTDYFLSVVYAIPDPHSSRGFSADLTDMGDHFSGQPSIINAGDKAWFLTPYTHADDDYITDDTYPYFTEEYGGNCQAAFALVLTDGAGPSTANIKNYDGTSLYGDSIYDEGMFGDDFAKTAADAGMQYYEQDLQPDLSNDVPTDYIDIAPHQHMVTYGLSFGVQGPQRAAYPDYNALCADPDNGNECICGACICNYGGAECVEEWKDPIAGGGDVLDDLWHATINSRGLFMYADNPQALIDQFRAVAADIERRQGGAASVATNSVERQLGAMIYQGLYNSDGWFGDLKAIPIDVESGTFDADNPTWSANDQLEELLADPLRGFDSRKIFTSDGVSTAYDFDAYAFGTLLNSDQVDYIMGDDTNEESQGNGGTFRDREYKLGDIVHSAPYAFGSVIYVGANDGMLHAFDIGTGDELWAYVPHGVHNNLPQLTEPEFYDEHIYYVDESPYVYSFATAEYADSFGPQSTNAYLAGGFGKGAKGVYCLEVTNAANSNVAASDIFNWEYSDLKSDSDLGYLYGGAYVLNSTAGPMVIFGNGYASDSGEAALYILSAVDGSIVRKFNTGNTGTYGCNGMSSPAVIDDDFNGEIDFVYAGDLDGNLWKFDLSDDDTANWHMSYGGSPLITVRDSSGVVQPITSEPDAMDHCDFSKSGLIVVVGTGQYLNEADLEINAADQAIYGIYDWESDLREAEDVLTAASMPAYDDNPAFYAYGSFNPSNAQSLSNINFPAGDPMTLLAQTQTADAAGYRKTTDNPMHFYNPYLAPDAQFGTTTTHAGWYYKLQTGSSERVVRDPIIRMGVVFAISNVITSDVCSGGGASWLYALDACSGGSPAKPQFDIDGDGIIDSSDTVDGENPAGKYFDTMLYDPLITGDDVVVQTTDADLIKIDITPDPPGMKYWRIIE